MLAFALLVPGVAGAVALGKPAGGQALPGAQLNVTQDLIYKYNVFLDENPSDDVAAPFPFSEFVTRTQADLRLRGLTLGVQFDFAASSPTCRDARFVEKHQERFGAERPCVSPNPLRGNGWPAGAPESALVILEKISLKYSNRFLNVELGDFYAAFGRGLVLSMVRQPQIDQDNSLLGGRFDLFMGPVDLTVLAGVTNPSEISLDLRNHQIDRAPRSLLAGASIKVRPAESLEFVAHGVGYELASLPHFALGGTAAVHGIGDAVDLFFEGDAFVYGQDPDATLNLPRSGHALYGTLTAYAGPLTLLVEGKRYKDAQRLTNPGPVVPLQYNAPPSLEYPISVTEDVNGSVISDDIGGARVQAELYFLRTNTTLTASMLASYDREPHPPFSSQAELTLHPYVGLDQSLHLGDTDLHLAGVVGYRHDAPLRLAAPPGTPPDEVTRLEDEFLRNNGIFHWNLAIGVASGKHAFEWVSYYRRYGFTLGDEECWRRRNGEETCDKDDGWVSMENALSYTLMGKYTAALHVDFTDDPLVQSQGNSGAVGNLVYDPWFRSSAFLGAELIVKPLPELEIHVFGGSQKSGIVCTGGACRTVPAFTGVKSRVTVSF